jgi:ABC-type multidrug transport system fused ATPase/permease subunit
VKQGEHVRNVGDQILVLDRGRIADSGRHLELLERSPLYAEIYHSQLAGDLETT